ncbi:MAG: hypothetical protein IPK26_08610 [Planctomycetes bacterium]|nr:hypothetical protein [Planctomycetota bacterium]
MNHPAQVFSLAAALAFLTPLTQMRLVAQGHPISFAEQYALAQDRTKVLEQLLPGTADYYYWHCLHAQNTGNLTAVPALLQTWTQRHGQSERTQQIEFRQRLLGFDKDPQGTLTWLQQQLSVDLNHRREVPGEVPDLPTTLDPALVADAAWTERAFARHGRSFDGFQQHLLARLATTSLDDDMLFLLLQKLSTHDVPGLPGLIARNLAHPRSGGFGSLGIHARLLLAQLDELAAQRPELLASQFFQDQYLARLVPDADVDPARDAAARQAWLERMWQFAQRLPPGANSVRGAVLFHRLQHDLAQGAFDKERFLTYLRLPRQFGYVNPALWQRLRGEELVAADRQLDARLPPMGDDEALVRGCFRQVFLKEESIDPYTPFIRREWLQQVLAETRLLAGLGDRERWYSLIGDPAAFERLERRVDIDFAPTQRRWFGADEPVRIEADVKNVDQLLVKVFVLDTWDYLRETGRDVGVDLDLDGLVANEETPHKFAEPAMRRVRRTFDLATLSKPGTYVVELVGNGIASRALIKKGDLTFTQRVGAAGHVLTVRDEKGRSQANAVVWCAGREYAADEQGEIAIPFAATAANRQIVLRHGELAVLAPFVHQAEQYRLVASTFVEREQLIAGAKARILVRPRLLVGDTQVSLQLLEQPELVLTARDLAGNVTTARVRDLKLSAEGELEHEISVVDGLVSLDVELRSKVAAPSRQAVDELSAGAESFPIAGIDATERTFCPLLARTPAGWVIDLLGKNGEPVAGRPLGIELRHRDYRDTFTMALRTDARGRIELGALPGIVDVRTDGLPDGAQWWSLRDAQRTLPGRRHGLAGEPLHVPLPRRDLELRRENVVLTEVRGGLPVRDRFENVAFIDGFAELRGLPAGDYLLQYPVQGHACEIAVTAGTADGAWLLGNRALEASPSALQIVDAKFASGELQVRLAHAGADTRVHVFATRFQPAFSPYDYLTATEGGALSWQYLGTAESLYAAGRDIGDEYRYILDRRFARKFPGNMLPRPGLLLNPWSLEETEQWNEALGKGGGYGGRAGGRRGGGGGGRAKKQAAGGVAGQFANLDFLPVAALTHANLRPDAAGVVKLALPALGANRCLQIVAVDRDDTVAESLAVGDPALAPRPRQLQNGLTSERHVTEQRRIEFVAGGGAAVIDDPSTTKIETYGSLAEVFALYLTTGGGDLGRFAFLMRWPTLTPAEKNDLYAEHACHEVDFFLYKKDAEFFAKVVQPYLRNKAHKKFLDHWLLGDDLTAYLKPWAFGRLNLVERILLAQRVPDQRAAVARAIQEQVDMLPHDADGQRRRFLTALLGDSLSAEAGAPAARLAILEEAAKAVANQPAELRAVTAAPAPSAGSAEQPDQQAPTAGRPALDAKPGDGAQDDEKLHNAEKELAEGDEYKQERKSRNKDKDAAPAREVADLARRQNQRALWRAPDPTRRLVERDWWERRVGDVTPEMIPPSAFWADFAVAAPDRPFCSPHFVQPTSSLSEMLLALAVLDLPFTATEPTLARDGERVTLRAATPVLLVRQELRSATPADAPAPVLLSQNLYRLDDRYRFEGNERFDRFVTDEFLANVVYGCQVVLTNPTSTPRRLELLLQIPQGAIPVLSGFKTRGTPIELGAFATSAIEYAFYFPGTGSFSHWPAHVGRDATLVAAAPAASCRVVGTPTVIDTKSWDHVARDGDASAVLAFVDGANLHRIDLGRILWRLHDRTFFDGMLARLRQRHWYDARVWAYGLRHADALAVRELLEHDTGFVGNCGPALASTLLTIDPVARGSWQLMEFDPLFHARAHRVGRQRQILDGGLAAQYEAFLAVAAHRQEPTQLDWFTATIYLLLQDRVEDALLAFARVRPEAIGNRIQYDYLRCYLDFFTDQHATARGIAEPYRDHPVARWRSRFREVLTQLDEAEGKPRTGGDPRDRMDVQTTLATTEPALELAVEGRNVTIRHQSLSQVEIAVYELDVEFSFSKNPFVQQGGGSYSWVRPNWREDLALVADARQTAWQLPEQFARRNVLVEVRGAGIVRRQACFTTTLAVQTVETYGQLRVTRATDGAPMPKVYVKVYAKTDGGRVRFHKDGYTDLRGRFDYASVSGEADGAPERFALLVLSENDGAVIREVMPPTK